MAYDVKVAYCGNVIEVYSYKENILDGYKNKIEKQKKEKLGAPAIKRCAKS